MVQSHDYIMLISPDENTILKLYYHRPEDVDADGTNYCRGLEINTDGTVAPFKIRYAEFNDFTKSFLEQGYKQCS